MKHYKSVKSFLEDYPCRFSCRWVGERSDGVMDSNMNHYRVTLTHNKKRMSFFFSQGYGIEKDPTLKSVIESVTSDIEAGEMELEDFCQEFGYGLKGIKIHQACRAMRDKWVRVFGEIVSISY